MCWTIEEDGSVQEKVGSERHHTQTRLKKEEDKEGITVPESKGRGSNSSGRQNVGRVFLWRWPQGRGHYPGICQNWSERTKEDWAAR